MGTTASPLDIPLEARDALSPGDATLCRAAAGLHQHMPVVTSFPTSPLTDVRLVSCNRSRREYLHQYNRLYYYYLYNNKYRASSDTWHLRKATLWFSLHLASPHLSQNVCYRKRPTISIQLSFNTRGRKGKRKAKGERRGKAKSLTEKKFHFRLCQVLRLLRWKRWRIINSYFPSWWVYGTVF